MSSTLERFSAHTIAGLCLAGLSAVACASAPPRASAPPAAAARTARVSAAQAAPAPAQVQAPADRVWTEFALGLHPGGSTASAAYIQADLIRRRGGEWVIVSLTSSGPAAGRSGMAPGTAASAPADDAEVLEVLREYERAFERRDAVQLGRVWLMNPSERSRVQRLFDRSHAIAVSIRDADVVVEGNRASLAFDQRFVVSGQRDGAGSQPRALRRALAARDSLGTWALDELAGTP